MIWDALEFVMHETALQLRRERLIAVATISTVAVLLLLLGGIVLFLFDLHLSTERILGELEIRAYFAEDFPRDQALAETRRIAVWPEIGAVSFVSKEEALKWLQRKVTSSVVLKDIGNPLPDGMSVRVKEPRFIAPVATRLSKVESITAVVGANSLSQRAVRMKRAITWVVITVSCLVGVAGVFIVHNTVRLSLHARWREIYIMQLVGATRAITAAPFLLEGAVHGALGAALAACVLVPVHMYLVSLASRPAGFICLAPDPLLGYFALGLVLSGAFLGVAGSALSIRRHLGQRREWQA